MRHELSALILAAVLTGGCGGSGGGTTAPPPPPPPATPPPAGLVLLPGSTSAIGSLVHSAPQTQARWCVYRSWPAETLHVFRDCGTAAAAPMPFTRGGQGEILIVNATANDDHLWLLTYDARENIPSGRIPGQLFEGIDVYRFARSSAGEPELVADKLPLGGFDNLVYARGDSGGVVVCATNRCFSVPVGGAPVEWNTSDLGDYEFVEVRVEATSAAALVRSRDVPASGSVDNAGFHYATASLTPAGVVVSAIPRDCVPFRFTAQPQAAYACVGSRADVAELLRSELARMPNDGQMDFGTSNSEGRVAWSQVYYLQGLLALTGGRTATLASISDWSELRTRVRNEVRLLGLRTTSAEGMASRRYSMQRTSVTFALHLGRTARTLRLATDLGLAPPEAATALEALRAQLRALTITVETPMTLSRGGIEYSTLGYRRGSDFWCDGANAPYNYVSAYVDGLLATSPDAADLDRATALMRPLVDLESLPTAAVWEYWWGLGREGWSADSGVSMNTPAYPGFVGIAHTTYRTMDASTLIRLHQHRASAVDPAIIANFRARVTDGNLMPWVNETFSANSVAETIDTIPTYRYARSAAPWEIQAQIWALEQLARNL